MAGVFLVAIWLPLSDGLFKWDPMPAQEERRLLCECPKWPENLGQAKALPSDFEKFYNDHFGLRKSLVCLHGLCVLAGLAHSDQVVVGKEGWLYYEFAIREFRTRPRISTQTLESWRRVLEERRNWLRKNGIQYLVLVAPDKPTIYPEYLPVSLSGRRDRSRLDAFIDYMRSRSDIQVLDLRPALLSAKETERVYCLTDSHWNGRGAFYAAQRTVEYLATIFPVIEPLDASRLQRIETKRPRHLADQLGLRGILVETFLDMNLRDGRDPVWKRDGLLYADRPWPQGRAPIGVMGPSDSLPKAAVFRDSFCTGLIPYLGRCFSRSVYYYRDEFDCDLIRHEKPDIVIDEFVERLIEARLSPTNNPPELTGGKPTTKTPPEMTTEDDDDIWQAKPL